MKVAGLFFLAVFVSSAFLAPKARGQSYCTQNNDGTYTRADSYPYGFTEDASSLFYYEILEHAKEATHEARPPNNIVLISSDVELIANGKKKVNGKVAKFAFTLQAIASASAESNGAQTNSNLPGNVLPYFLEFEGREIREPDILQNHFERRPRYSEFNIFHESPEQATELASALTEQFPSSNIVKLSRIHGDFVQVSPSDQLKDEIRRHMAFDTENPRWAHIAKSLPIDATPYNSSVIIEFQVLSKDNDQGRIHIQRPKAEGDPPSLFVDDKFQDSINQEALGQPGNDLVLGRNLELKTSLADLNVTINEIGISAESSNSKHWDTEIALDLEVSGSQQLDAKYLRQALSVDIQDGKIERREHITRWNNERIKTSSTIEMSWTNSEGNIGKIILNNSSDHTPERVDGEWFRGQRQFAKEFWSQHERSDPEAMIDFIANPAFQSPSKHENLTGKIILNNQEYDLLRLIDIGFAENLADLGISDNEKEKARQRRF